MRSYSYSVKLSTRGFTDARSLMQRGAFRGINVTQCLLQCNRAIERINDVSIEVTLVQGPWKGMLQDTLQLTPRQKDSVQNATTDQIQTIEQAARWLKRKVLID